MVFIHLFIQKLLSSTSGSEVECYIRWSPTSLCLPLEQLCPTELSVIIVMNSAPWAEGIQDGQEVAPAPGTFGLSRFSCPHDKVTQKLIGITLGIWGIPLNLGKVIINKDIIPFLATFRCENQMVLCILVTEQIWLCLLCAKDEASSVGLGWYFQSHCPRRWRCLGEVTVSLPLYLNLVLPQCPKDNGFCGWPNGQLSPGIKSSHVAATAPHFD